MCIGGTPVSCIPHTRYIIPLVLFCASPPTPHSPASQKPALVQVRLSAGRSEKTTWKSCRPVPRRWGYRRSPSPGIWISGKRQKGLLIVGLDKSPWHTTGRWRCRLTVRTIVVFVFPQEGWMSRADGCRGPKIRRVCIVLLLFFFIFFLKNMLCFWTVLFIIKVLTGTGTEFRSRLFVQNHRTDSSRRWCCLMFLPRTYCQSDWSNQPVLYRYYYWQSRGAVGCPFRSGWSKKSYKTEK